MSGYLGIKGESGMLCRPVQRIYYNSGNGYTVADYQTQEELPKQVVTKQKGYYGLFRAVGVELPNDEGLEVELTGEWKEV